MNEIVNLLLKTQKETDEERIEAEEIIKNNFRNNPQEFSKCILEAISSNRDNHVIVSIGFIIIYQNLTFIEDIHSVLLLSYSFFGYNNISVRQIAVHTYTIFSKLLFSSSNDLEPVINGIYNLKKSKDILFIDDSISFLISFLSSLPVNDQLSFKITQFIINYFFLNTNSTEITKILLRSFLTIFLYLCQNQEAFDNIINFVINEINILEYKEIIYDFLTKVADYSYKSLEKIHNLLFQISLQDLENINNTILKIKIIQLWTTVAEEESVIESSNQYIFNYSSYLLLELIKIIDLEDHDDMQKEICFEEACYCLYFISRLIPNLFNEFVLNNISNFQQNTCLICLSLLIRSIDEDILNEYAEQIIKIINISIESIYPKIRYYALNCIKSFIISSQNNVYMEQFIPKLKISWNDCEENAKVAFKSYCLIILKFDKNIQEQFVNEFFDSINDFNYISDFINIIDRLIKQNCVDDMEFSQKILTRVLYFLNQSYIIKNSSITNSLIYILICIFQGVKYSLSNVIQELINLILLCFQEYNSETSLLCFSFISFFDPISFRPFLFDICNIILECIKSPITGEFLNICLSTICNIYIQNIDNFDEKLIFNIIDESLSKDFSSSSFSVIVDISALLIYKKSFIESDLFKKILKMILDVENNIQCIYNNSHHECFLVLISIGNMFKDLIAFGNRKYYDMLSPTIVGYFNSISSLTTYSKELKEITEELSITLNNSFPNVFQSIY